MAWLSGASVQSSSIPRLTSYDRLRALAAEVTRVTLEVGSQGKLGGQAHVPDVEGVWFELVRNVGFIVFVLFLLTMTRIVGQPDVFFLDRPSTVYRRGYHSRCSGGPDAED